MVHQLHRQFVGRIGLLAAAVVLGSCREETSPATPAAPAPAVSVEAIETSLTAADQYFNAGKLDEARAILETLVAKAPDELRARELLGQTLSRQGMEAYRQLQFDEASALREAAWSQYEAAVDIEPASPGLHHSAGMVAHAAGRDTEALAHFLEAGRLAPADPQPALFAAQLLLNENRMVEAEAELKRAEQLDPDQPAVYASLAVIALKRDDYEAAQRLISEARALAPNNLGLLAQEARIHRTFGHPRRALEMLLLLSDWERADEAATTEIAAAHLALDEPLKAARAWEHRMRSRRNYPRRWRDAVRAAEAYLDAGEREQAWLWLTEAKLVRPDAEEVKVLEARFAPAAAQP